MQSPSKLFCVELSVSVMNGLQMITVVSMLGLIQPIKWKRPILSKFHEVYIIHVWQIRYG